MTTVEQIDACLPQTQCTQCSYPGCQEYAQAIHDGNADINQCPPGGDVSINLLARLLQRPAKPLNNDYGETTRKAVAKIIEKDCIGCMLCIKACPVDAIIGTNKMMHTVIDIECTGCELCLPPCPMDCIEMVRTETEHQQGPWDDYSYPSSTQSRNRRKDRQMRLSENQTQTKAARDNTTLERKKVIEDALNRARMKSA